MDREKYTEILKKHEVEKNNAVQSFIQYLSKSDINANLCSALKAANIPLNK